MRNRILAALAGLTLVLGLGAGVSPAVAAPVVSANQPPKPTTADKPTAGKYALKGSPAKAKSGFSTLSTWNFFYNVARQTSVTADGMSANLITIDPYLDTARDAHSLVEVAVSSADSQQHVEMGITKDPVICGVGAGACLFSYWWKNGVPQCYNGCGFVDYAPCAINVGSTIPPYAQKKFTVQYSGGVWWLGYDVAGSGCWVGYYPGSLWTSPTFTQGGLFQGFGEVASSHLKPCSDMGYGTHGGTNPTGSPRIGSLLLINGSAAPSFTQTVQPAVSPTGVWGVGTLSATTMAYGGPGWNAAGTGVGVATAC